MPQHFYRISSVLLSEGKAVPLPYSASNACCKDELHLALTITFPLSSFLPGAPEFFIRCHSGLSTSIRCASSLHPAVNVNTWRNCIFFYYCWDPDDFPHVSWITVCANPAHVRMVLWLFLLHYWFVLYKYTFKDYHLWLIINPSEYSERLLEKDAFKRISRPMWLSLPQSDSVFETKLNLWPAGQRNYWPSSVSQISFSVCPK